MSWFFEKQRETVFKREIMHGAVAFGGGVLIAAVGFVLTPRGIESLSLLPLTAAFAGGGVAFFVADMLIERRGGALGQLLAMMMDFLPEAVALGAVFAHDHRLGLLLAVFIGLQNLPESFNSYLDLRKMYSPKRCLLILLPLSLSGILAALMGNFLLSDSPTVIAVLMVIAAGGIVYLTFQDIAPLAKMKNHWSPALGATLGFLVGMIGHALIR